MNPSTQPHAQRGHNEKPHFVAGIASGPPDQSSGRSMHVSDKTLEHIGGHPACPTYTPIGTLPGRGSGANRALN